MGCCLTTNRPTQNPTTPSHTQEPKPQSLTTFTQPPLEEETVKEVLLSETPVKAPLQYIQQNPTKFNTEKADYQPPELFLEKKFETFKCKSNEREHGQEEEIAIEQELLVSETYSFSLSESTTCVSTTTTMNNDNDDDHEVREPLKRPRNRARLVNNSPNRRSGRSAARHNEDGGRGGGSERLGRKREPGVPTRNSIRSDQNRGDPGQDRRSKSPATNRSEMGRKQSPGRVKKDLRENKWTGTNSDNTDSFGGHVNETLANPLVALECFIFL